MTILQNEMFRINSNSYLGWKLGIEMKCIIGNLVQIVKINKKVVILHNIQCMHAWLLY